MMRRAAPRASQLNQLTKADLRSGRRQRRFKTFVKRVDKNNEIYYTRARNSLADHPHPDPDKQYEFFAMPDLLLDLDAEGTRLVRPFADADEQLFKANWGESPERTAARSILKQMEEQVYESRQKVQAMRAQTTTIWRITPHDVISTALHGGSATQTTPARDILSHNRRPGLDSTQVSQQRWQRLDLTEKLRAENGIPPHAVDDDQLLLRWMTLRRKALRTCPKSKTAPPSPSHVIEAIKAQSSLMGIRRLVFQCLAAGTSISSFQRDTEADSNLPRHIRDACIRILSQDAAAAADSSLRIDALAFLGNLAERLLAMGAHLDPLLCGTALALSAQSCSLEVTSVWLHRCHQASRRPESADASFMEDLLTALTSLCSRLSTRDDGGGPPSMHDAKSRQLLLQLLTGIDENKRLASDSFRSFAVACLDDGSRAAANAQRAVYAACIRLLGLLGAVRTLWREWRELPCLAGDAAPIPNQHDEAIALSFGAAMHQAVHVMGTADPDVLQDTSLGTRLEECVTMDYHAIEAHLGDAGGWRALDPCSALKCLPDGTTCRSTLNLPLEACVQKIKAWGTCE
ncbi:uncharacterized protein UV8b_02769 [Ustilaginoidea virens]|uniref:Uncharacterized protein n=1 Tax=Ustilaginoidea virens TaxID=1159556 RepID=A0A1B5L5Q8_USTVR|nr:uncharacterized protein UV8b_02769 [Ustilaginoidea virens]QUC18528.1 hypothetical protein UV8b_02769 [Ustilaginoidea virens]GAO18904.1 hypothetical protein UVI_02030730 [Ustilaginoidea virens]